MLFCLQVSKERSTRCASWTPVTPSRSNGRVLSDLYKTAAAHSCTTWRTTIAWCLQHALGEWMQVISSAVSYTILSSPVPHFQGHFGSRCTGAIVRQWPSSRCCMALQKSRANAFVSKECCTCEHCYIPADGLVLTVHTPMQDTVGVSK